MVGPREDMVLSCLNAAARRALEEKMESGNYEIQSEFLRKYIEKGRIEGKAEGRRREGRGQGRGEGRG